MVMVGGALVGLWAFIRRGLVASVQDISGRHDQPCAELEAHKTEAKSNYGEIFLRLANLDSTVKEIQAGQLRAAEKMMDMADKISFLSSRMGYRETKEASDIIPTCAKPVEPKTLLLIADDRPDSLSALITMIEELGYTVMIVTNCDDGMDALRTAPFRVAIIDAEMESKFDGIDFAAWSKKHYPDIDVILYTGHDLGSTPPNVQYYLKTQWKDLVNHLSRVKNREIKSAL